MARRLVAWTVWWVGMWWLWMLLVGDWNRYEWIGGACVATVGATLAELVRKLAGVPFGVPLHVLRSAAGAVAMVFVDFGILALALVRRREGRFVVRDGAAPTAVESAWRVYLAGLSPNAYVVDVDPERDTVLLHDLVPHRQSEKPAAGG